MLARSPTDGRIVDNNLGRVVWKRRELGFACQKTPGLPFLLGVKEGDVDVQ